MPAAWLVDLVRAYRALGFFQSQEDHGNVRGDEPGFAQVALGLPLPAHGRMGDEAIARLIEEHHRAEMGTELEPGAAAWIVPEYDPFRWARLDAECVGPGEGAYVDALLAVARVSRGAFRPTDLREAWDEDGEAVSVSFRCGGRLHTLTPEALGDMMDTAFLPYVNDLMAGSPYQLRCPATGDQTFAVVAVAPTEVEALERLLGTPLDLPQREAGGTPDGLEQEARARVAAADREAADLEAAGRDAEAAQRCRSAIALARAEAERNPGDAAFFLVAELLGQSRLGNLLQRGGDPRAAAEAFGRALELLATLLAEFPGARAVYGLDGEAVRLRYLLADALRRLGRVDDALALCRDAIAAAEGMAEASPPQERALRLALLHEQRSDLLLERDPAECLEATEAAAGLYEEALRLGPGDAEARDRLERLRALAARLKGRKRPWWKLR